MPHPKFKSENYTNLGGINTKVSQYTMGPHEFLDLTNLDFSKPGSLTKVDGFTQYIGATTSGRITGLHEFEKLDGSSYMVVTANTNAYTINSGAFNSFHTGLKNDALFDFVTLVDRLFMANGQDFFKFSGTSYSAYSLPPGISNNFAIAASGSGSMTGRYYYAYAYLNDAGYLGPGGGLYISDTAASKAQFTLSGMTTPAGFGITAIAIFRTEPDALNLFFVTYSPANSSTFVDVNFPLSDIPDHDALWFTLAPRYMEVYNNQLFMAGFSSLQSTVYFSEVGEPEKVLPESSFEVRTNDGDRVTGLKSYNGNLFIFKKNSFHRLSGDNPDTFLLSEVSQEYGCLSNRATAVYENKMLFLDKKGIVEFNGANIDIISATKVEPIFNSMNQAAAEDNAESLHNRPKNEVLFSIPCNGATMNNCFVVYDYLVKAFYKREGANTSSITMAKSTFTSPRPFFGSYSGGVFNFGPSLMGDNGNSITCIIQTRFLADEGQSEEKQFRRLFMNVTPISGATGAIGVEFYKNYDSSTVIIGTTMYQGNFQSRIDFGISAKSLSAKFTHTSSTLPFQLHGYSIAERKQRDV